MMNNMAAYRVTELTPQEAAETSGGWYFWVYVFLRRYGHLFG
ncbi:MULTISPECIES: hypothetical protein [Rhizobium]|nr:MULTISPECIES: hypothetical protein [Rhizobium]